MQDEEVKTEPGSENGISQVEASKAIPEPQPAPRNLTCGEKRVRTNFNVSASTDVDAIKQNTAALIDAVEKLKEKNADPELARLVALANTSYENAAMWAVKAATF